MSNYSLDLPPFPFRALAGMAGRGNLGGEREAALAIYMAARLAGGMLGANRLSDDARTARAVAARGWFASAVVPAPLRAALAQVADAGAVGNGAAMADAIELVAYVTSGQLDGASASELAGLVAALRGLAS